MREATSDVYLDVVMTKWIATTAYKEHWRVARWISVDDLIQEGYVAYTKCRNRYTLGPPDEGHQALNTATPTLAQRKHFMALVQRAFYNAIFSLVRKHEAGREEYAEDSGMTEQDRFDQILEPAPELASLSTALLSAPAEIREALARLVQDGLDGGAYLRHNLLEKAGRPAPRRASIRETSEEHWGRVSGCPELECKLTEYLIRA